MRPLLVALALLAAQPERITTRTTDARGSWSPTTRLAKGAAYRYVAGAVTSASARR